MGILKTGLKIVGSAALGTAGIASSLLRKCACATGNDGLADVIGSLEDKSFDTIRDMWTPEEKKDDEYYENQAYRSEKRAEAAASGGESLRRQYEKTVEKAMENQQKK